MATQFAYWHVTPEGGSPKLLKFNPIIDKWTLLLMHPGAQVRKMTDAEIEAYRAKSERQSRYNRESHYSLDI